MIKLDTSPTSLLPIANSNVTAESAGRLLVLVPPDIDHSAAIRGIWEHASVTGMHVQLLGLCKDTADEPVLRRGLVIMASLLQDGNVPAELRIEHGISWLEAVKRTYQPGDRILCFVEQRAGLLHRPVSQILQSNLDASIYIMSHLSPRKLPQSNWLSQFMAWLGFAGIIVGSFLLQAKTTSLPQDWAQTTLMIFSVAGEIWFIWLWNNLLR